MLWKTRVEQLRSRETRDFYPVLQNAERACIQLADFVSACGSTVLEAGPALRRGGIHQPPACALVVNRVGVDGPPHTAKALQIGLGADQGGRTLSRSQQRNSHMVLV